MWAKAQNLSSTLHNAQASAIQKQYVILSSGETYPTEVMFRLLNEFNINRFDDWDHREDVITNVYIVSTIKAEESNSSLGGYKCTCKKFMDEYDCEHALAMAIAKNKLPSYMSMKIPIGQKKGPGRPKKAVAGALKRQDIAEEKIKNIRSRVEKEILMIKANKKDKLIKGTKNHIKKYADCFLVESAMSSHKCFMQ